MPDFDLSKSVKNGFNMRKIFVEIISFSVSVFLAFQWQALFSEIVLTYFPKGQNLIQKTVLNMALTVILVVFIYILLRWSKDKKMEENNIHSEVV